MARKASNVDYKRISFCVPTDDVDTINWMASQHNLSMSLRTLVKNEVQKNGISDYFCKPITNPGVSAGRPKQVQQSFEPAEQPVLASVAPQTVNPVQMNEQIRTASEPQMVTQSVQPTVNPAQQAVTIDSRLQGLL